MEPTKPTPAADPVAARRRRTGRRAFIILGIVAAAVLGGYLLYGWWTKGKIKDDNAEVDADVVPVAARVGGVVQSVAVHDHERVEAGHQILVLDPTDLNLKIDQAKADLAAANASAAQADAQVEIAKANAGGGHSTAVAGVTESNAGVRSAQAQVTVAQSSVDKAQADFNRRKSDLERDQKLVEQGAIPAMQLDNTRSAFDNAQSALDTAKAQLAAAREGRSLAAAKVAEAKGKAEQSTPVQAQIDAAVAAQSLAHAKVDSATVALAQAQKQLDYATVSAPIAGTVSKLAVQPGQSVQPGMPLVVIVPDETYVVANIKETEIGRIAEHDPVDIDIDAYPDKSFHGEVEAVAAATGARFSLLPPDNASGNFVKVVQRVPVKIRWTQLPDGVTLRPGLSAEVVIHVSK